MARRNLTLPVESISRFSPKHRGHIRTVESAVGDEQSSQVASRFGRQRKQ